MKVYECYANILGDGRLSIPSEIIDNCTLPDSF